MIYLKKGQTLFDNPGMVVYDSTGYYNDGDSIVCAPVFAPEEPACRYEAQYIAYGGIIYSVSDQDELIKKILELDPKSLFGKDSQQVAVDKIVEQIVPQAETVVGEESLVNTGDNATTTPAVAVPANNSTSTTTPDIILPGNNTSTTTPGVVFPPNTSTTTPEIILPENSTTTPVTFPNIDSGNTSTTTPYVDINTSTTTTSDNLSTSTSPSIENISEPVSSSTPAQSSSPTPTPEPTPEPTSTPTPVPVPSVLDSIPESNTSTTTDEIVAYAKQKIVKKIFNI